MVADLSSLNLNASFVTSVQMQPIDYFLKIISFNTETFIHIFSHILDENQIILPRADTHDSDRNINMLSKVINARPFIIAGFSPGSGRLRKGQ